ncbi:MAG: winged helix DNA-binding domain-containing protein [Chloroflexota bacterium]|nr:winged helix DNA-binding domain-containing protein [Chloroflexota bacterium]
MRHIGYLQLDPTNVVARNQLLVLWSRLGRYKLTDLDRLMWRDRELFELITFIAPMSDLPLHLLRMRALKQGVTPQAVRMNAWVRRNEQLRRHVVARLRKEGPLPLSAFEDRSIDSWTTSASNDDRNVSRMLSSLIRLGEVTVGGRASGRRFFTLAKEWFPRVQPLAAGAASRLATNRALAATGVATFQELRRVYGLGRFVTAEALAASERDGIARRVEIAGLRGPHFALTSSLRRRPDASNRTTLLSPFDNLIIDRQRTELLFGMRYRMEIYVPKHLRVRGFWAMPILHRDQIIGTVDPKMDREHERLDVLGLHLERDAPRDGSARRAIEDVVDDLAAFAGAREVAWPKGIASSYSRR